VATVPAIRRRLAATYGVPSLPPHGHPIAELVLTVLSQSTNDRNRDVAYLRLRDRFPDWVAVRDAPLDEVEAAIRPGGLSPTKSVRIQEILRALPTTQDGEPTLDGLPDMPVVEARALLTALPGVGRKTAACVLLFSFGMRDVPVDTHVGRVGARLGLLPAKGTANAIHDAMLAITPRGAELEFHVNLLRHGRRTCHSQRPQCPICPLLRLCPSADLL
jgi:endonuclease-3